MKNTGRLFVAVLFLLPVSCGRPALPAREANYAVNSRLQALLDQKEYFRLETQLNLFKDSIGDKQRLFFQAFLDNAFNRNEKSLSVIDTIFKTYASTITDTVKAALTLLQDDDYFKLYQYSRAAKSINAVLSNYQAVLDSEKISDIKNDLLIRNALKNTPPQEAIIRDSAVIHWKKDRIGLFEIPVKSKGRSYDAIFDTRANISSISQTYAAKLGLKMLDVSYEEGSGITGIRFKTGLGIADSIYIGNILMRHAVFQVMPDSILYLAPINFSLNIIIGFPIIEALKEVHIYKDGRMIIPSHQSKSVLHNFALDHLDPVISLKTGNDTLCFHLDLGAGTTDLYCAYFEKYKSQVLEKGDLKAIQIGGAGGIQKREVYIIPAFTVYLGDKKVTIDSVAVHKEKIYPAEKYYGNLGQDFIAGFTEIVLNFRDMYISVN